MGLTLHHSGRVPEPLGAISWNDTGMAVGAISWNDAGMADLTLHSDRSGER